MSERWKYQIRTGLPFGIIMPVLLASIEWYGTTFESAFLTQKFLIQLVIFLFVGVFLIGYSNWRERQKGNEYNKQK